MNTLFKGLIMAIILIGLGAQISIGQGYGLKGVIYDSQTNEKLEGVTVTLKGTVFGTVTKTGGKFLMDDVPPGSYTLVVNAVGFQLLQGQMRVNADMDLGALGLMPEGVDLISNNALQKTIRATNIAESFTNRWNLQGGGMIYGLPEEPKQLVGNYYLDEKWNKASILLYKDGEVMEDYWVRYNIERNIFEILPDGGDQVATLQGIRVQNLVWRDADYNIPRYFINGMDFKFEGAPVSGFFEVLVEGNLPLIKRTIPSIRKSNYNTALMIGEKDDKIVKRDHYYFILDKEIFEVPKKKKQFLDIFTDHKEQVLQFVEENKLNIKNESHIYAIFSHYNGLFPGYVPLLPPSENP